MEERIKKIALILGLAAVIFSGVPKFADKNLSALTQVSGNSIDSGFYVKSGDGSIDPGLYVKVGNGSGSIDPNFYPNKKK